jgi:hypothetical protein
MMVKVFIKPKETQRSCEGFFKGGFLLLAGCQRTSHCTKSPLNEGGKEGNVCGWT